MSSNKRTVLVVGATGATGSAVIDAFKNRPDRNNIRLLAAHRKPAQADDLKRRGVDGTVMLDLDQPASFKVRCTTQSIRTCHVFGSFRW